MNVIHIFDSSMIYVFKIVNLSLTGFVSVRCEPVSAFMLSRDHMGKHIIYYYMYLKTLISPILILCLLLFYTLMSCFHINIYTFSFFQGQDVDNLISLRTWLIDMQTTRFDFTSIFTTILSNIISSRLKMYLY